MSRVTLRTGRVQPVWAGHPWVFAQAIERVDGAPAPGDAVEVLDPKGNHLGRGFWSPRSAIPVRIVTRRADEALDEGCLVRRIEAAARHRRELGLPSEETDGFRLIHAEGDGLPGLIADVFRDVAVVQLLTIGMKRREDALFAAIARVTGARTVVEVPGGRAQQLEGIEIAEARVARGPAIDALRFRERGLEYAIPPTLGQKTGFYFDQRDNRALVERLASGKRVLDLYSYVGAFGLAAARGGAREVLAFDSSASVVAEGARIAAANGLADRLRFAKGDVKNVLGALLEEGQRFDLVMVDPPKLAPTARHLTRAQGAYRKLNTRALTLLERGGLLVSSSCSSAMRPEDFLRTLALAGRDAAREVTVLYVGQQGMDHPVPAAFPEGRYLKCAILRAG
jgi:23S rRNA (cytosine1962-C5)-methyltransferase